jgi:hypothetical protein
MSAASANESPAPAADPAVLVEPLLSGHGGGVGPCAGEIEPRAKAFACPREHDCPHAVVGVGRAHGVLQVGRELVADSVEFLGSVEGDRRDAVLDVVENRLVCHGGSIRFGRPLALLLTRESAHPMIVG